MGSINAYDALLDDFDDLCQTNDWSVAFVHTEPKNTASSTSVTALTCRRSGKKPVVDLEHFETEVRRNKYFRQIKNRFEKQGYHCEVLMPPHSAELMESLGAISKQWLSRPGRSERGFMMGYFSSHYMQECELVVLKDNTEKIIGFLNPDCLHLILMRPTLTCSDTARRHQATVTTLCCWRLSTISGNRAIHV